MRRVLGAVLIALPIVAYLTVMGIAKGWAYVVATLVVGALSLASVLGGIHLLSSKSKDRRQP